MLESARAAHFSTLNHSLPSKPAVLAVDGNSLAYRAYFALPTSILDSAGHPINAVYGFLSMLVRLIGDHRPQGVLIAFDSPWPTLRHGVKADYKANRQPLPAELLNQIPILRAVLSSARLAHVALSGYEADDIVATAAAYFAKRDTPTLLITGDRDLFQMVNDPFIRVLYTRRGVMRQQILDEAGVKSLVGIEPHRYLELAALRGDPSDNISGIPGIGEKTALRLVSSSSSFDDLLSSLTERYVKQGQTIRDHVETLRRNYDLMKLNTEVPIDWSSLDISLSTPDQLPPDLLSPSIAEIYWKLSEVIRGSGERPGLTDDNQPVLKARRRICLVSCSDEKKAFATQAKDLYQSSLFQKSRAWAQMVGDEWFVLSGLHGLLSPEAIISPYDRDLNELSNAERAQWAQDVVAKIRAVGSNDLCVVLSGGTYGSLLTPMLRDAGTRVAAPLMNMSSDQRLEWLDLELSVGKGVGDLEEFYEILQWAQDHTGGLKRLDKAHESRWPTRGVYFFLEDGEYRFNSERLRVTRVGTHAVSANSKATLWNRLRTHRGIVDGGGNHRSSIFRSHVGAALLHRQDRASDFPHWGDQYADQAKAKLAEEEMERAVTRTIGQMLVSCLEVDDDSGPSSDRAFIERNSIALLSSVGAKIDRPSKNWIGRWSPHASINESGLWNVNYVNDAEWHPGFLEVLDHYARVAAGKAVKFAGSIAPHGWWLRRHSTRQSAFDWDKSIDVD